MLAMPLLLLLTVGNPEPSAPPAPSGPPRAIEAAGPALETLEQTAGLLAGPQSKVAVLAKLKRAADADRSAVVTPQEASDLKRTVELGLKIAALEKQGADRARIEAAVKLPPDELDARVALFRNIALSLEGLPGVTVPNVKLAARRKAGPGTGN